MASGNISIMNSWDKCRQGIGQCINLVLIALLGIASALGAIISSAVLILPVVLISRNSQAQMRRVRKINHLMFHLFTRLVVLLGLSRVSFLHGERLNCQGQLIIANHPSFLDIVFLIGYIPNPTCVVVKKKLLINPLWAIPVYFAGYVINDGDEYFLEQCADILKRGESLIIFPEGTRTEEGDRYQFKNGAAHLMLMSDCLVRLVHIACDPPLLTKRHWWYKFSKRGFNYNFTVLPELDIKTIRQASNIRLGIRSKRLTKWLANWYTEMNAKGAHQIAPKLTPQMLGLHLTKS